MEAFYEPSISIALFWANYGPYHHARATALSRQSPEFLLHPIEIADRSDWYPWEAFTLPCPRFESLFTNAAAESLSLHQVWRRTRRRLRELRIQVCFIPSYWPRCSLAVLLAAKSLGLRTVMMNESHAGTARANGPALFLKKRLVNWFDAALVGGQPQIRYFTSLGFPSARIFAGYDAVDNEYFQAQARKIRADSQQWRTRWGLPERYFLSLGRLVRKKNLSLLFQAYARYVKVARGPVRHLVVVGSGDEEPSLRLLCAELQLPVYERPPVAEMMSARSACTPGVHFHGFVQINDSPVYYALADAFILPSTHEEWGLVVNEAMASGLAVLVSSEAGCAEDLVVSGRNGLLFKPQDLEGLELCLHSVGENDAFRSMGLASQEIISAWGCERFAAQARLAARKALDRGSPS